MGVRDPAAMYTAPVVFVVSVMFFPGDSNALIERFYPANPGALIVSSSLRPGSLILSLLILSMGSLDINIKNFTIIGKSHIQQKYD
jgi:hypothetical protein